MAISLLPVVQPLELPKSGPSSKAGIGATVSNVDLAHLTDDQFKVIERALYTHKVLVFPDQHDLNPDAQFDLVRRFDPSAALDNGHNYARAEHKGQKSLLHGIGNEISLHPEVKLVGGGKQPAELGGHVLKQAAHDTYHRHPLSDEQRKAGLTRWHRWHMDASLYKTSLPIVTTLLAVRVPKGPPLTVVWDDGSGNEMKVEPGTTGFVDGKRMLEEMSERNRNIALHSKVFYAPHPYQWGGASKGRSNGLGTVNEGKEMAIADLPPWTEHDLKVYPMVWTNPVTGEKSFQAVWKILLKESADAEERIIDDLAQVREMLYEMQRPVLEPENVLAPPYREGDLVMFYNRGVYHSATDYPEEYGTRSMLQAHIAATYDPK